MLRYKMGLDIGNSAVKGAILGADNTLLAEIESPSMISCIPDSKYLTFENEQDCYFQILDSKLEHFDEITAVGQKALDLPQHQEYDVFSSNYKTGSKLTAHLLFGALINNLTDLADLELKLAVSIPIVEAKRIGLVSSYYNKLIGTHRLRILRADHPQGYQITINITAAKIVNEGQAGFFGLLDTMDQQFQGVMNNVYSSLGETTNPIRDLEDFIVVDIGEGTTDISVFKHKKFNPDYSFSLTQGIGNILENARALAAREQLLIDSRKELQHVLDSTSRRQESRRRRWESYVRPNVTAFIDQLTDIIIRTYGNNDYFDAIIFLGGGFTALTGYGFDLSQQLTSKQEQLFDVLRQKLKQTNKTCDLIFGLPAPYARSSNRRGLTQLLTIM